MDQKIVNLFQMTAFDPETVKVLCSAYEMARKSLHDTGPARHRERSLAERIIVLAKQGERNPDKLCDGALKAFGTKAI